MQIDKRALRRIFVRLGGRRVRGFRRELAQRLLGSSVVNEAGIRLHLDPSDERALVLFARGGLEDVEAVRLWNRLAADFKPTIVLDVGANYGEVALSRRYDPDVAVHLVEANPRLVKRLQRSTAEMPNTKVHNGAATSSSGTVNLYRHSTQSGYSSIRKLETRRASTAVKVNAFRLDERLTATPSDRLLFKIDVEGAEIDVLDGMTGLLDGCEWMGMVETVLMQPDELDRLRSMYRVTAARSGTLEPVPLPDVSSAELRDRSVQKRLGIAKDVVVEPFQEEGMARTRPR